MSRHERLVRQSVNSSAVRVADLMDLLHEKTTKIRMLESQLRSTGQTPVSLPPYATEAMFVTPSTPRKASSPRPPTKPRSGRQSRSSTPGTTDRGIHQHASAAMTQSQFRLERRLRAVIRETAYITSEARLNGFLKRCLRATERLIKCDEVKLYLASAPGQTLHDITWYTPQSLLTNPKFDFRHLNGTKQMDGTPAGALVSNAALKAHASGQPVMVGDAKEVAAMEAAMSDAGSKGDAGFGKGQRTMLEQVIGPASERGAEMGWRSFLAAPLTFGGGLSLGVIECTGVLPNMFSPADATMLEAFTEVVAGCLVRFRNQNILDYNVAGGGIPGMTASKSGRRAKLNTSLYLSTRDAEEEDTAPSPFTPMRYTSPQTARLVKEQLAATDKTWNRAITEPHVGEFKQHRFRPFSGKRPALPKPVGLNANYTKSPYKVPPIWPYNPSSRKAKGASGQQWHRRRLRQSTIDAVTNLLKLQPIFRGYRVRRWMRYQYGAASVIQAIVRGFLVRSRMRWQGVAAMNMQRSFRGHIARNELRRQRLARATILRVFRGHQARNKAWLQRAAGEIVRKLARGALGRMRARKRRRELAVLRAAMKVQSFLRGISTRRLMRTATKRQMLINRARQRLRDVSAMEWEKFINQKNPSTASTVVAAAVCVLMNIPRPSWRKTQKLMKNAAFLQELLLADKNDLPERELSALEEILKYEVIKDAAKDSSLKAGQALAQYLLAQL